MSSNKFAILVDSIGSSDDNNSECRDKLLVCLTELSQLQINNKIPVYNHFV